MRILPMAMAAAAAFTILAGVPRARAQDFDEGRHEWREHHDDGEGRDGWRDRWREERREEWRQHEWREREAREHEWRERQRYYQPPTAYWAQPGAYYAPPSPYGW